MRDFGRIYNEQASSYETEKNPVVVIPGILGSRLKNPETGDLVWGSFLGSFADPDTPEGVRQVALPLSEGRELNDIPSPVEPDGVLGRIEVSLFGLPVELNAYYHILQALGAGGYVDREIVESGGAVDYGTDHFSCFQYPYDWRRDISHSAKLLHEFLLKEKAYVEEQLETRLGIKEDVKFVLVAHSMGGLLARYYLRYGPQVIREGEPLPELTWEGAKLVRQLVVIGTPNAGSIQSFSDLLYGKDFGPITPSYSGAVLGTMPAVYQLLPRVRHKPFQYTDGTPLEDIYDVATWEKYRWGLADPKSDEVLEQLLPHISDPAERRKVALEHLERSLTRARQFAELMDKPAKLPEGLKLSIFVGDNEDTKDGALIDRETGEVTLVGNGVGDGLVLRSSALLDERVGRSDMGSLERLQSPIDWTQVTFLAEDHLGLTRDPTFIDNILYTMLESPIDVMQSTEEEGS